MKRLGLLFLGWIALGACANDPFDPSTLPNQRPKARIFVGSSGTLAPTSYNGATFHWSGSDADGRVVGFHVGISLDALPPTRWIFTTGDESTATYATDVEGRVSPTLYVAAVDDRDAISDTVSVTFPLVNFPPTLEFIRDFKPLAQSFGAASFEFLGFDLDGDETLRSWVDYRFAGSDPGVVVPEGQPGADPATAWVRLTRDPKRFSLALRNIPPGDPAADWAQTLYVRIEDEAGSQAVFSHTWQVFEVRGQVLLIDDNLTQPSRDAFYRDALTAFLGDQYSVWDVAAGLPERDTDLWLTLSQFRYLVWYTSPSASPRLLRSQAILQRYVTEDLDPATPGIQNGRLYLENQAVVGTSSNLSATFRGQVLGITSTADPRNALERYDIARNAIGSLQVYSQVSGLPDVESVGLDYLGGAGIYFGLFGLTPATNATALYRFENHRWGGSSDPTCRLGCEPIVAVRRPATGLASVVTVAFQLDYANALGNAGAALAAILRDHLGVTP